MKAIKFKKVKDDAIHERWELEDVAAVRIRRPTPGGQIWTWTAWTDTGRIATGMAHSRQSAEIEGKASAVGLMSEDLDHGLPRTAKSGSERPS